MGIVPALISLKYYVQILGFVSQACCYIITAKYYSHMEYKYERIEESANNRYIDML